MTQSPQEEGTLSDFDVANRICGEELLGPVVRRRGPALPTKRINWLPHPSDDLCTIQLKRFIHKYRLRPNNTKANHEFEQRIWTVYMTLDLNRGSIKEKARVYNEFLKYDKLRLYLDSILEAKIHECEVRLADSPSASCKKTLMRAKNEFRGALKAAISDKQKAIAKNSMICETGDENYY
ncbi:uncharacterized protein LOC115632168 [Scaptodrosophila lebanonensis]|uniref:Uncharacterized protein LOC115632168 n=1 Tax=Drosophila lebanonensis TaxID=7225 RepID=A0A6J2U976_DROLE|nr:uncharacterized protein LOC115632168 [Scaptodrosophila lebanonensis]